MALKCVTESKSYAPWLHLFGGVIFPYPNSSQTLNNISLAERTFTHKDMNALSVIIHDPKVFL